MFAARPLVKSLCLVSIFLMIGCSGAAAKAKDHTWHAFAARARILIVNTKLVTEAERPRSLLELTEPRRKGRFAMAKPLFGTSATQAACLFEVLGPDKAKDFYHGLRDN